MIEGTKPHKGLFNRLKRLSRSLSRKEKGSKNRDKAKRQLSRLHARIGNIRQDSLHQLTTDLTRRFSCIVLEDLNVKGMMANRCLARSIGDMGFYELRRQLEYKAKMHGGEIMIADRWYASSKRCSNCDYYYDALTLKMREWDCPACGSHHDRDINAALNLKKLVASFAVTACGEEGSDMVSNYHVKPASMKQEPNAKSVQV